MIQAIKTVKTAIVGENPEHFICYDNPSVEQIQEDEEEKISDIIESFRSVQEKNLKQYRYGLRGTHSKTQGVLKGTLTVPSNLPAYLSQGLFKNPGKFPVVLRYANEPTQIEDDRIPGPRSLNMKVFNVPGVKLHEEENSTTQDFFFNNVPSLELTNLIVCRHIQQLRDKYFDHPEGLQQASKQRDDAQIQLARFELPNTNIMGQYIYFHNQPIVMEIMWLNMHFFHLHPVEDPNVERSQLLAPFYIVATLDIPRQEAVDPGLCRRWHDDIRLYPWAGLEEHRPLGSINRVRKRLYDASAAHRANKNEQKMVFPQSMNDILPQTPL